ncbi:MAG: PD-(D/E)XK nuclease family protein [Bacteroidales bacterium]|nr:PD-(D/E)XK nuclease family protein [Bacteroidales bacterium]
METFLQQVAQRILDEHPTDADTTLVVFNNHRSERFLQRAFETLSRSNGTTFFLPRTTVIDDLVGQLSGLQIIPNEFLLFELFDIHQSIGGENRKYTTFEEFISFGDIMLADFSEIDRYCVDAHDLFVNLHDLKAIGEWDISNPHLSPFQRNYLAFYRSLFDYYTRLRQRLLDRGQAYGGMAYRHVADRIPDLATELPYSHLYFVGFNALSECERRIIGHFVQTHRGTLLTDADTYYYTDPQQEAGLFLRRHSTQFPTIIPHGPSHFATASKDITIVECPEPVMQCKYVANLLTSHPEWLDEPESTAIVLADEKLLIPMLNALPDTPTPYKVNISLGYTYAESQIHSLTLKLLALYRHATPQGYLHTDLIALLSDRLIGHLTAAPLHRQQIITYLERENRIRCHAADLAPLPGIQSIAHLLPPDPPDADQALTLLDSLTRHIAADSLLDNNKKEQQALGALIEILTHLRQLQSTYHYLTSVTTLEHIYTRLARHHNIAFLGQPLSGLQIFGMLETRNLDFKRIILLSANEGILPSARSQNTLIPYELQRAFHLPTYEEKESVYAYNFYHLLQRTTEAYLLYTAATDTLGKNEQSRFLRQLQSELAPRHPESIHLRSLVLTSDPIRHLPTLPTSLPHTPAIDSRLQYLAQRGLSPTALTDYLLCPLRYYYTNLLGLKPLDNLDNDLDDSQFGSCIHSALQQIYTPYLGRTVSPDGLRQALANLPTLMQQTFAQYYRSGRSTEGRNHLLYSVGESQIRHLLQREIALLEQGNQIEILGLEKEIILPFPINAPFPVNLRGTLDRIDRLNGQLRILDYKTGKITPADLKLSTPKLDELQIPAKPFQLLFYAYLYTHDTPLTQTLQSGIYPLRNLNSDVCYLQLDSEPYLATPQTDRFHQALTTLLTPLLDPNQPFTTTTTDQNCNFCPARPFCTKHNN